MTPIPPRAMPETFRATLIESQLVTPRVKRLVFEREGAPFNFTSGQWVSVVLPLTDDKGRPIRRSYSLASVPAGAPRFELVVTRVENGVGSTWLHAAPVGTSVEFKGPQGTFTRPADHAGPALMICTGTGVAPFRGMIHDALTRNEAHPLTLLFGVRTEADLLFADELRAWQRSHPQFTFEISLSQPPTGWSGRVGYVQTHVESLWAPLTTQGAPHAYICGVKKMLLAAREVLKGPLAVERQRIHVESYD